MTALAEALLSTQRQAIAALSKAYVAGTFDDDDVDGLIENLNLIGCTDAVDQQQLKECLMILRAYGAPAPPASKPDTSHEPASERQLAYIRKLADERGTVAPDFTPTKEQASRIIEELKVGTYNPDAYTVPF